MRVKRDFKSDSMRWNLFSGWISTTRQKKGLTQQQAAEAAGLNSSQLWSRYENTKAAFQRTTVRLIARGLGVEEALALQKAGYLTSSSSEETFLVDNYEEERWWNFSQWLQWERKSLILSQKEAAARVNKTPQWWSYYENGNPVRRSTVIMLANALQLPIEEALIAADLPLGDYTPVLIPVPALPTIDDKYGSILLASQAAVRLLQLASQGMIGAEAIENLLKEYEE